MDSIFLLFIAFFIHYPWINPLYNIVFFPSFVLIFIELYEDMKKWAKQRKRRRAKERYEI